MFSPPQADTATYPVHRDAARGPEGTLVDLVGTQKSKVLGQRCPTKTPILHQYGPGAGERRGRQPDRGGLYWWGDQKSPTSAPQRARYPKVGRFYNVWICAIPCFDRLHLSAAPLLTSRKRGFSLCALVHVCQRNRSDVFASQSSAKAPWYWSARLGGNERGALPRLSNRADGRIKAGADIDCADDAEAIEAAERLVGEYPVELWQDTRMVARLEAPKK
jgi:hypothetical protein